MVVSGREGGDCVDLFIRRVGGIATIGRVSGVGGGGCRGDVVFGSGVDGVLVVVETIDDKYEACAESLPVSKYLFSEVNST